MSICRTSQFKLCPVQGGKFMKKAVHHSRHKFLKWSRTFIELSGFSESEKSLKHEFGSI